MGKAYLGSHKIGLWLIQEHWSQEAVAYHLGISRNNLRRKLSSPGKHLTMEQMTKLDQMLPNRTFADIINSITMVPMSSPLFVEEELLITPRLKKTSWTDMD